MRVTSIGSGGGGGRCVTARGLVMMIGRVVVVDGQKVAEVVVEQVAVQAVQLDRIEQFVVGRT